MAAGEAPKPAGFGNCAKCAYLTGGPAGTCFACASKSFERLASDRCELCELPLDKGECGNPLCKRGEDARFFRWVWAISMRTGALRRAIDRYKVDGKVAWARIFGRVLLGYLNSQAAVFERYDLIIASPTFVGSGGRSFDHTQMVIEWAAAEDDGTWPFTATAKVIEKTKATTPFRGRTWQRRREIAETELRSSLVVPTPAHVNGRRVLVFDDVYTEGLTLREVARALRTAGATEVSEVVLARQPFGGSTQT